jgi:hypothetical protein
MRFVAFIVALFSCIAAALPEDKGTWGRALIDEPSPDAPASRVAYRLVYLDSTVGHLVGEFEVVNTTSTPEKIEGAKTPDGKFWATVEAQVTSGATPSAWRWKAVGKPPVRGEPSQLLVEPVTKVSPPNLKNVFVDLDIFKPFIGKETYGRIFLPNGRWSMFELNDLLPPKT